MQRNEWTFDISAKALSEASISKMQFHDGKLKFWQDKQVEVMAAAKDGGITIQESAAGSGCSNSTLAMGPQIAIDTGFQRQLEETSQKIAEHRARRHEYDGWVQVLSANAGRTYSLNADDYLYFFGK